MSELSFADTDICSKEKKITSPLVVELVDTPDLGSGAVKRVRVRVSPSGQIILIKISYYVYRKSKYY